MSDVFISYARKDGEIFVVWVAKPLTTADDKDNDLDGYERFDRIMFFADGDFHGFTPGCSTRRDCGAVRDTATCRIS